MLLQNLRAKIGARLSGKSEEGFTLIELLVVMLILGILAAIALPAFFNQRDKAGDAEAKSFAHSAQVAMETYATDNGGSYAGADAEEGAPLIAIEPTLANATMAIDIPENTTNQYEVTITSDTTNTFSVANNAGSLSFPCTNAGNGGCPNNATVENGPGDWGG